MRKKTTKEFIENAFKIHGNKYDYSLVKYLKNNIKVKIICPLHGIFEQRPANHINISHGCPKCSTKKNSKLRRKTTEKFIEDAIKIHSDKYDYSLVDYKNNYIKVKIICKKHGIFKQRPNNHLNSGGCPKCAGKNLITKNITEKFKEVHGDKYDYSLVEYNNSHKKIKIKCTKHGIFEQTSDNHLNGRGCPKCAGRNLITKDIIEKFEEIHGDKYVYSNVNYKNSKVKVEIICPVHGVFEQTSINHLSGRGCPVCRISGGENKIIKTLNEFSIKYDFQKTFDGCKYKQLLQFDFYLPEFNVCIEYDGKQHYKPIDWFGGEENFKKQQLRDEIKEDYCKNNGIDLLRIPYTEFDNIKEIIINKIRNYVQYAK